MKVKITNDRYISLGDGGISEGSVELENGEIRGAVECSIHGLPKVTLTKNTTNFTEDQAKSLLAWGQIMLGLDENENCEIDLGNDAFEAVTHWDFPS